MQHMKGSQFGIGELLHLVFSYQSWKFLEHNTTLELATIFIFTPGKLAFETSFPNNHGKKVFRSTLDGQVEINAVNVIT